MWFKRSSSAFEYISSRLNRRGTLVSTTISIRIGWKQRDQDLIFQCYACFVSCFFFSIYCLALIRSLAFHCFHRNAAFCWLELHLLLFYFFFSNHLPLKKSQIHANQFLIGIFLAIRNAPILVIGSTYTHTWSWYACVIVCMYVCWKSGFVLISYGHKRNEQSEMEVKFNEVYIHSVWLFFLFFSFCRVFFGFSFSYWMLSWWRRVLYLYAALCAHQLSI